MRFKKFTAPPAKFYFSRRVPDFGIFSLDLDTVTLGVGFQGSLLDLERFFEMDVGS